MLALELHLNVLYPVSDPDSYREELYGRHSVSYGRAVVWERREANFF